jgi:hypothetical protein
MGLHLYYSDDTAPVSHTPAAGWEVTSGFGTGLLSTVLDNFAAGPFHTSRNGSGVANDDSLHGQFISEPIAAGTISGTVKGQLFARAASGLTDARAQIVIKVISNDGSTVRGTLLDFDTAALSSEFNISASVAVNRMFPRGGSVALSSVVAQAGDRLCIEVGHRNHGTNTGVVRITSGDDASPTTDLPEDETQDNSGTHVGWIEFSQDIGFLKTVDETGVGVDDIAISNQFEVEAETGLGTDDLTVAQQVDTPLDEETGTGTDNLLIEAFTSLSTGRLVIGRFMTEEPGYTIADEIISHEQIDEGRMRPNIVMVDGEDDSWTEYDRADLLQRDTPVNAYLDLPELKSVGSVRQRAVEEQAAAQRSNSPGGEIVWDTHLNRLDRIYWVTENGIKYETRIEGLEVEFNQSMTPFQRASIDTGVVVLCPPEEEDTYLVRDLFERETANGIGDADTGGTWETY